MPHAKQLSNSKASKQGRSCFGRRWLVGNALNLEAAVVSRSTISSTACFARPASKSFMVP